MTSTITYMKISLFLTRPGKFILAYRYTKSSYFYLDAFPCQDVCSLAGPPAAAVFRTEPVRRFSGIDVLSSSKSSSGEENQRMVNSIALIRDDTSEE